MYEEHRRAREMAIGLGACHPPHAPNTSFLAATSQQLRSAAFSHTRPGSLVLIARSRKSWAYAGTAALLCLLPHSTQTHHRSSWWGVQDAATLKRIQALFQKFESGWARESLPTKDVEAATAVSGPVSPHEHAQHGLIGQIRETSHPTAEHQRHQQQNPAREHEAPVSIDAGAPEAGAGPSGAVKAEAAMRSNWGMAGMGIKAENIYGAALSDGQTLSGVQQAAHLVRALGKIADATEEVMPRV